MKKFIFIIMTLILSIVLLSACGSSSTSNEANGEAENEENETNEENEAEETDFPNGPITLIVPYDAGGGTDLGFRALAPAMEEELGVPVVVQNKAGGNGWVGWEELMKSEPDGYTISAINGYVEGYMNPSAKREETLEDITVIANHVYDPGIIASTPGEDRFTTIEELMEYAKENEVKAAFSSVGSDEHFSILTLNKRFGTKFVPVQFGGGAKAITALLGEHVDVVFANVGEVVGPSESGQLDILTVFSEERISQFLPDVPTLEEAIGEEYVNGSSRGLGGPAGMDPEIVEILNSAIEKASNNSEHLDQMTDMGLNINYLNAADFTEMLENQEVTVNEYIDVLGWGE
ncbi:hypothetical protein CIL05_17345 [Virgibacillus profundi]|uniref:Uncharacterized protein n=1 Tax=Virgibacillus profundi TaxID=2024555 RepID=A0A2A2IAI8_9BACI|nr:tripartite tricarboxylate transporter substrate binding protein [Virgibacillus profundi]PAV28398.1 hypothetical protein CIL05_17345 [Virgibacillus profundi]PXY52240.1 tripartite tricarboxylate transporter substrate binding protein [Virgibacillus profundi]